MVWINQPGTFTVSIKINTSLGDHGVKSDVVTLQWKNSARVSQVVIVIVRGVAIYNSARPQPKRLAETQVERRGWSFIVENAKKFKTQACDTQRESELHSVSRYDTTLPSCICRQPAGQIIVT